MTNDSSKIQETPSRKLDLTRDTRGGGVTEYVILIGCVAVLAYAGFHTFGTELSKKIESQKDVLTQIPGSVP